MTIAITFSRASFGIQAPQVTVEVHISNGLPKFTIVGLPETTVKESKDRVRSALINSHFDFPSRRITVNLAPAELPKDGGRFDLPIAIGILAATGQIDKSDLDHYEFAGELALSGELRMIKGALPLAIGARNAKRTLIVPMANAPEVALAENLQILPAKHLLDISQHLCKQKPIEPWHYPACEKAELQKYPDFSEVRGQPHAKRAMEIVAAGGHSLLMYGPPGTGKSMLASRLPSILPNLSENEALEVASIASIAKKTFDWASWRNRPFRAPHHSASSVALVGGGTPPRPGEISLAHQGILFLDELPEFDRKVIEALREPLESGTVTISRAAIQAEFPAQFQLIAAMNPCPCGYLGDPSGKCTCIPQSVARYRGKISGPILDRIDLFIEVARVTEGLLQPLSNEQNENSTIIKKRVVACRELQFERQNKCNARLQQSEIDLYCALDIENSNFLEQAIKKLNLSARALHRILKISRTIADLEQSQAIEKKHLLEALSFRKFDKLPTV